jgi:hypothetical protein
MKKCEHCGERGACDCPCEGCGASVPGGNECTCEAKADYWASGEQTPPSHKPDPLDVYLSNIDGKRRHGEGC